MRGRAFILALGLATAFAAGCTWLGAVDIGGPETTPENDRADAIYAAVVRQLLTRDHTYGQATLRYRAVYVLDGPVPDGVNPTDSNERPRRPFSEDLKAALGTSLADLAPLTFVRFKGAAFADQVRGGKGHVALVALGPIQGDRGRAEVGANLWMDGYPLIWLTYVVLKRGETWRVTGTTGPIAIA